MTTTTRRIIQLQNCSIIMQPLNKKEERDDDDDGRTKRTASKKIEGKQNPEESSPVWN